MQRRSQTFTEWAEKFNEIISKDCEKQESFKKLVAGGCEKTTLRQALFLSSYSRPREDTVDSELSHILRGLDSTTAKLLSLAESAEVLMNVQSIWIWSALYNDRTLSMVAKKIRDSRRALLSASSRFDKFSQAAKPWVKGFLKAKNPNQYYQCALARYVEKTTKHKYYRALGQLLEAAHSASGGGVIAGESFAKRLQLLSKNKRALLNYETAPFNFDAPGTPRLHALPTQ